MKLFALAATALFSAQVALAQSPASVEVVGPTGVKRSLSAAQLAKLPHVELQATSHEVTAKYRGVPVGELFALVGTPSGDSLRGASLASYVLVEAADGYRVVFALAEFDPSFGNRTVILADLKDGKPMDARTGPFQLISPDEKRPARWVRQVTRISVVQLPTRTSGAHKNELW